MIARPVALELAEQIEDEKGLWGAPDPPSTRRASPTNHSTGPARRYLPGCADRAVVAAKEIVEISTERSLELEPDLPASMGRGPFGGGDDCAMVRSRPSPEMKISTRSLDASGSA